MMLSYKSVEAAASVLQELLFAVHPLMTLEAWLICGYFGLSESVSKRDGIAFSQKLRLLEG
jgi:hypothetical protein